MKSKQILIVAIAIVAALTIVGAALWGKGTEYENTWLYLSGIWIVLISALDAFIKHRKD